MPTASSTSPTRPASAIATRPVRTGKAEAFLGSNVAALDVDKDAEVADWLTALTEDRFAYWETARCSPGTDFVRLSVYV